MPSSLDSLSRLEDQPRRRIWITNRPKLQEDEEIKIKWTCWKWKLLYYVPSLYICWSKRLIAGKTGKLNYILLFGQLQVLLSSVSAPVLILVKIFAQIRESVFNFSNAVVVVNQSRREVCQPGFLAIIGPKLADGPPILQEKYKMPQIQIRRHRHKFAFLQ